jgi:hypothetical protein
MGLAIVKASMQKTSSLNMCFTQGREIKEYPNMKDPFKVSKDPVGLQPIALIRPKYCEYYIFKNRLSALGIAICCIIQFLAES